MLKRRIIPIQLLLNGRLVKTVQFNSFRDVGDPIASSRVYNAQNADELIFLNINRDARTIDPLLPLLERVSEVCFMPLALGGGVRSVEDAARLIRHGADKVVVNSAAYGNCALVHAIAEEFGSQAVVVGVDARCRDERKTYVLYADCGRVRQSVTLEEHVARVVEAGAGEVLVNAIDRDGTMNGYDIELLRRVTEGARVPVIACGGAGHYEHLREAFVETRVSAVACGSLFNFGDNNPIRAKAFLTNHGIHFKQI